MTRHFALLIFLAALVGMTRYQCPLCERFHPQALRPRCTVHGLGYSPRCTECVTSAANPPCGGAQS